MKARFLIPVIAFIFMPMANAYSGPAAPPFLDLSSALGDLFDGPLGKILCFFSFICAIWFGIIRANFTLAVGALIQGLMFGSMGSIIRSFGGSSTEPTAVIDEKTDVVTQAVQNVQATTHGVDSSVTHTSTINLTPAQPVDWGPFWLGLSWVAGILVVGGGIYGGFMFYKRTQKVKQQRIDNAKRDNAALLCQMKELNHLAELVSELIDKTRNKPNGINIYSAANDLADHVCEMQQSLVTTNMPLPSISSVADQFGKLKQRATIYY